MKIHYVVYKCTNDMGHTHKKDIGNFEDVNSAITLHAQKSDTGFTWYEIEVEYQAI